MLGNVPREIWDNLFAFRQPIPSLVSSEHSKYRNLWNSIFKSDAWIQEITRLQGNPLLFGPMLDKAGEKNIYVTIHCGDGIADPNYRWELFLECLHPSYKYNPRTKEVKFRWDITLNVSEIESPEDPFLLNDKTLLRLLSFKDTAQPTSQFSFFGTKQILTLQPYQIISVGEPPYYSKALKYGYVVTFQDGNKTTQVYFESRQKRFLVDFDCEPHGKIIRMMLRG